MSSEQGLCPACRTEQLVKKDGTLGKHLNGNAVCEGWNLQPVPPEYPAEDAPQEPAEDIAADDDWDDDAADEPATESVDDTSDPAVDPDFDDDTPDPADAGAHAVQAPSGGDGVYRWQMTVKQPAIYLDDADWHQQNALAAALAAERAGHTLTGEARWTGDAASGHEAGTVLLTYLVPVGS
jgi:hypothetical protein